MRDSENMGKLEKRKYSRGMGSPIPQPSSLVRASQRCQLTFMALIFKRGQENFKSLLFR